MTARNTPVVCAYSCDGIDNPPKGACGGKEGHPSAAWKYVRAKGEVSRVELPAFAEPSIAVGEAIVSECSSGGGYGDPLDRDARLVCHRVREGWITKAFAEKIYGVIVDDSKEIFVPNEEATRKCREAMRKARG